jgi:hypothetical protein
MEELTVIELACNSHRIVIDKDTIDATSTYSYKYYDLSYDAPTYYTEIVQLVGEDTTIDLTASTDGVYLLVVKKSKTGVTDVMYYSMMAVLCQLETCKNYILQQILCDSTDCTQQHDCDNCDRLRDEWNIRLSEMHMMHYELKRYIDLYAATIEELIADDAELILIRLKDIVSKINVMTANCTTIRPAISTRRCNNCN